MGGSPLKKFPFRSLRLLLLGSLLTLALAALSGGTLLSQQPAGPDCTSPCPPSGDAPLLFCDVGLLEGWAEAVFMQELRAKLGRKFPNCTFSGLDLSAADVYVSLPPATADAFPYTFSNATFQLYGLRIRPIVVRPGEEAPLCPRVEIASPQTPSTLPELFGDLQGLDAIPRVASDLIRFVFIPRITPIERGLIAEDGETHYAYAIAPASAVPSRIFEERLRLGELGVPVGLDALQRQLEPEGRKFIEILQRHFASTEGAKRLDDRRTARAVAARTDAADQIRPRGPVYTRAEVEYFELQHRNALANQLYPDQEERLDRRGELGYLSKFQRFWEAVDRAKALLEARAAQEQNESGLKQ